MKERVSKDMNYTMRRIGENIAEMETEEGCHVKLLFTKEYNAEAENIVTNNLLTSYERRICDNIS